jgi:CBS domain containing-hemolysin-like protein
LQRAVDRLDAYLAATQLGITISSLSLGWIGEPALARLIEPWLAGLPHEFGFVGAHAVAVVVAFALITALHIVLGELAPKSLALQRSERTALIVIWPLELFMFVFRPAILSLNALGNLVLRLVGLTGGGGGEGTLHSAEELKLLVAASHEGGLLHQVQQELVERVFNIAERRISDIMTPRPEVEWFDVEDPPDEILGTIRACRHEQLLAGRGSIDEPLGMVVKQDLLDQVLDGNAPDPVAAIRDPLVVHESMTIFKVLDQFKRSPVRLAIIVDEYGILEGIVTQTDLLEAIAGNLPASADEEPEVVEREDGSLLIDGMMAAPEAFERLGIRDRKIAGDFHTAAGFVLSQLGHLPDVGETFSFEGWRFEIVDMDGHRIDKLLVTRQETPDLPP